MWSRLLSSRVPSRRSLRRAPRGARRARSRWSGRCVGEDGQTTAEYALVILGAAAVATILIAWAKGGAIQGLFDNVISKIIP